MNARLLRTAAWLALACASPLRAAVYEVAQRNSQAGDQGDGSRERPWKSIGAAVGKVAAGDKVLIRDGIYREQVVIKVSGTEQAPIIFEAAPGANVVLTGADVLKGWQKSDGGRPIYHVPWNHRFISWNKSMTHPDDEYHRLIGRCEQVMIDGYMLRQVLEFGQLAPGTFFADLSNGVLDVWDSGSRDLSNVFVEASTREVIAQIEGDYVQLQGLHFRFAANMAQHGAVVLAGKHDEMDDCTFEDMNSSGATFSAEHQVVRRCVFRDNGQLGFGANGAHDLLFTDCLVENNNTKGFDRGWEAGGDKLVLSRNAVLERSRFLRNRGNGIWFDIGNEHCVVRQCLIADNEDSGIFCEISYGLQAMATSLSAMVLRATGGAWGAQAGISLSSSPECLIERNIIMGNREGFDFREQTRTTPRIDRKGDEPIWNHDETIRHNIIAYNRDAQIWGWFDMHDNRHWPASLGIQSVPDQLTLEKLRLNFENNVYYAAAGEGWFEWGVTWARHKSYPDLSAFQADVGIDKASRVLAPDFANPNALDFRLSPEMLKSLTQNYPQEPVPGVILNAQR